MAARKSIHQSTTDSSKSSSKNTLDFMLPQKDVARLVKLSREGSFDVIKQIAEQAVVHCQRLGIKKGGQPLTATEDEVKTASVQVDVRSFFHWMERIPSDAKKAKAQLAGLVLLLRGRLG